MMPSCLFHPKAPTMPQYQITLTQAFQKPVEQVFDVLADHNQLARVFGVPVKRIKDGQAGVNGVGSVRRIGAGPVAVEETVTALEANKLIGYRITKGGAPMSQHRGEIRFERTPTGCTVNWQIQFQMPPVLGGIVRSVVEGGIAKGLRGLA